MKKGIFIKNGVDMNAPEKNSAAVTSALAVIAGVCSIALLCAVVAAARLYLALNTGADVVAAYDPCASMEPKAMPDGNRLCYPSGRDLSGRIHARGEE